MPRFEYAPAHRIETIIQASADDGGDAGAGWERWRQEAISEGEWWYRRRIEGSDDDDEIQADADELEAEILAIEEDYQSKLQAARDRLADLRARYGEPEEVIVDDDSDVE